MQRNKKDREKPIEFGNHKMSINNIYILEIKFKTELEHTFVIPIPLEKVISIIVTVMDENKISEQSIINELVG